MADLHEELHALHKKHISKGCANITGLMVQKARGALLWDARGREYIDFVGGIGVMNVGHSHPRVVEAICGQAKSFTHTCLMISPYEPAVRLARRLCAAFAGEHEKSAFFANSGAEAVENAVKIARYHTRRPAVIAFEHAFHGRTLLGMTLTSKVKPLKTGFYPLAADVYRLPFAYCYRCAYNLSYPACDLACAERLEDFFITSVAPESVAAVIAEPVPGEGGFLVPPEGFFRRVKEICEKYGILFIADEIQTGMGRTGTLFAMEQMGVEPDLTTTAKSLAAGMPLSAVVGRKEIMDSLPEGGLGGTYGGNPVACAAALAVLGIFEDEDLLSRARAMGEALERRMRGFKEKFALVGDVRGLGPMRAMELVCDRESKTPAPEAAKKLIAFCLEKGLVLLSCGAYGNVVRVLAPLVTPPELTEKGLSIMEQGLEAISS